jgi:dTDP-glucose pyrophosphorylase
MPHTALSYPIIPASEVKIASDASILKGLEVINNSVARIALVVDTKGCLKGSLVDGDIRRALLSGCTLESPVSQAMYPNPISMPVGSSRQQILDVMHSMQVKQMPLLETDGALVGIATYDKLAGFVKEPHSNPVVIMAGGKGQRLLPLTQDIPKPMVEVSGKPMLEHIIEHFTKQGFSEFYLALNHLGHIIEEYFGDGHKWNCHIHYIRETKPLGTAGALSLIETKFTEPFIVINGDILTSANFVDLLDYHSGVGSMATVCARAHRMEVPFGVIQIRDGMMQAIVEKPVYEDLVSAGIYVLDPQMLQHLPHGAAMDMPTFLQTLVKHNQKVAVFPLHEDWADVGRHDDLNQAERFFASGS